jgi:hypothetical protein
MFKKLLSLLLILVAMTLISCDGEVSGTVANRQETIDHKTGKTVHHLVITTRNGSTKIVAVGLLTYLACNPGELFPDCESGS